MFFQILVCLYNSCAQVYISNEAREFLLRGATQEVSMRFVIIGGDAAGMSAASRARRKDPDLEIVVLEQTRDVSYSACGMPYTMASADRTMEELVVRPAGVFREKYAIDLRLGHQATAIDPRGKRVEGKTDAGERFDLAYDALLLATGASPVVPEIFGVDLEGVHLLKSLEQGRGIKAHLDRGGVRRAVIIGMGYIALEMAETLQRRGVSTRMVKPRPRLLPWLDKQLADAVQAELEDKGVELFPGTGVQRIERNASGLVCRCDGMDLEADMVLAAIGVKPNSDMAAAAGLELGPEQAIAVNHLLQTSQPDIYSAGDCADARHLVTGQKTWIPLALVANRGGRVVADNVTGGRSLLEGIVGTAVFKVFGLEVAKTGINRQEAEASGFDPASVTISARTRAHAHPGSGKILVHMVGDRNSGRLLGVQMVGQEGAAHRINAPAVALHAGMSVDRFARTDLAYAPPFGPVWDPMLTAANQLLKQM